MAKDEHQSRLPFGAAEVESEARINTLMQLVSVLPKRDLHLREFLLKIYRLETPRSGLVMTHKQLCEVGELCCTPAKLRAMLDLAKGLEIITCSPQRRLDSARGPNEYRLHWPRIHEVIATKSGMKRHAKRTRPPESPPAKNAWGHAENAWGHVDSASPHAESAGDAIYGSRARASFSRSFHVVVDDDCARGETNQGGDDDGPTSDVSSQEPEAAIATLERTPPPRTPNPQKARPQASAELEQLIVLVSECDVELAEFAVQRAIENGLSGADIRALVAGWRRNLKGWDEAEAPRRLYYRLKDRPRPGWGPEKWRLRYPNRVASPEAQARAVAKRQAESAAERTANAEKAARSKQKAWLDTLDEKDRLMILDEYFSENRGAGADAVRSCRKPFDSLWFLTWLVERNGGAND